MILTKLVLVGQKKYKKTSLTSLSQTQQALIAVEQEFIGDFFREAGELEKPLEYNKTVGSAPPIYPGSLHLATSLMFNMNEIDTQTTKVIFSTSFSFICALWDSCYLIVRDIVIIIRLIFLLPLESE